MKLRRVKIAWSSFRRETDKGWLYACRWFAMRFYYRYVRSYFPPTHTDNDDVTRLLSVIVPVAEKDFGLLGQCLAAANGMMQHPLKAKWVVGPESIKLRAIASEAGWDFIPEDKLLPKPAGDLKCRGWILQQFIKYNAAFHVPTEDYLVLDADTIFLRPQTFFRGKKTVLRYADQYELLYNRSLELIFGHKRRFPVSFVTHYMVFNRQRVQEVLNLIEHRFAMSWWEAILNEVDRGDLISFSEYELYGNYIVTQVEWKKLFVLEHWAGLDRHSEDLPLLQAIKDRATNRLNSVSFHHHTQ